MNTRVETIKVTTLPPADFSQSVTMGTAQSYTLTLTTTSGAVFKEQKIDVSLITLQHPQYQYTLNQNDYVSFSQTADQTDVNGQLTAT